MTRHLPAHDASPLDELRFDTVVSRALVHRAAVSEVFVTDSVRIDPLRFLVAAQLPRMHSFYNDSVHPQHDVLLLVEIARQAGVLIAHRSLGVPADRAFIFHTVDIGVDDAAGLRMSSPTPSCLVLEVTITRTELRGGTPRRLSIDVAFVIDGRPVARGCGSFLFLRRGHYHALRRQARSRKGLLTDGPAAARPNAIEPRAVGRRDERNVVISPPAGDPLGPDGMTCEVVVDQDHAVLFDHPLDHIPGVVMLESYRQAALFAARSLGEGAVVSRCRATFAEFGELELPTHCRARVSEHSPERVAVEVALHQDDQRLGEGRLEVIPWP